MNILRTLVVTLLTLLVCAEASAEYPDFQPYGAWRGRIRYFDGPFRSGARVRWGNGITPTGGQVLIQGFNTLGNIATSSEFWDGLNKALSRGAKPVDPALDTLIGEIQKGNNDTRKDLNDLLAKLNVPLVPEFTPAKKIANSAPAAGEIKDAAKKMKDFTTLTGEIVSLQGKFEHSYRVVKAFSGQSGPSFATVKPKAETISDDLERKTIITDAQSSTAQPAEFDSESKFAPLISQMTQQLADLNKKLTDANKIFAEFENKPNEQTDNMKRFGAKFKTYATELAGLQI